MKAVQRTLLAWRRFFFVFGCNPGLHTVILNSADPGWPRATRRRFVAVRCA
jgi:hypothetical protein